MNSHTRVLLVGVLLVGVCCVAPMATAADTGPVPAAVTGPDNSSSTTSTDPIPTHPDEIPWNRTTSNDTDPLPGERTVLNETVGAGEPVSIVIETNESDDGNVLVFEDFSIPFDRGIGIDGEPAPALSGFGPGTESPVTFFAAWEDVDAATVEYEVLAPTNIPERTTVEVTNDVNSSADVQAGTDEFVVDPYLPYADDAGMVETSDIRRAVADWMDGRVRTNVLSDLLEAWQRSDSIDEVREA